jgi:hypothetical protein
MTMNTDTADTILRELVESAHLQGHTHPECIPDGRVVCQFSCGAASAVATKLAIAKYGLTHEVLIVNAFIVEEDADNRRFLADCERWFSRTVNVLRDTKYGASIDEVWRRRQYMKGLKGAPCSAELKRKLLDSVRRPDDIVVFGFDRDEADRFDDFRERYPDVHAEAPLIDAELGKADCLAMVQRAGIELPLMYRQGFENANCPGCPKGGEGYWNRIRVVRPEVFQQRLERQESIGPGAYFFRNRLTEERFGLKDLDPKAGRHNEPAPQCSFFCEIAEQEYTA